MEEKSRASIAAGEVLLGKYRVESTLGRGGMGVVVAARHIDLDELFAVKLMITDGEASAEAIERFLREARAAAKIKSEHVARVQDVGRLPDGTPYMVMEYLAGSDLRRTLRARGPLPVQEAVTYVLQACETLSEAHGLGIIHRDIKPANLFLTRRRNGSPCVKVLDFGISKHTGDAVGLTITATVGGSPLYMSPEQMRSSKHVDARTDIWSTGIVLYELLTGKTPFHAEMITAVAGRVLQDEPEPPSRLRPEVSPALDAVVLKCLAKSPDDRFASVDELAAALRAAVDGAGELGLPAAGPALSWGAAEITSGPMSAAHALTLALPSIATAHAASAGATSAGLHPTAVTRSPAVPRPTGRLAAALGGALVLGGVAAALAFLGRGGPPPADGAPEVASPSQAAATAVAAPPVVLPTATAAPAAETGSEAAFAPLPAPTSAPSAAPAAAPAGAPGAAPPAAGNGAAAPPSKPVPAASGRKRRTID